MMYIGESEMDERGRITIPKSFRDANGIEPNTKVKFYPVMNTDSTVRLIFEDKITPPVKEQQTGV